MIGPWATITYAIALSERWFVQPFRHNIGTWQTAG